jgi:DNA-binding MarR family transcriptional regulator
VRVDDDAWREEFSGEADDLGRTAIGLALAMSRLRSRLREEAGMFRTGLSISQFALIGRLIAEGSQTAASLASAEHVSQQAVAQSLTLLKAEGLVGAAPDPNDGRKTLLSATPAARALYLSIQASRELWLIRAIEQTLSDDERLLLVEATALLERLAAADVTTAHEYRQGT